VAQRLRALAALSENLSSVLRDLAAVYTCTHMHHPPFPNLHIITKTKQIHLNNEMEGGESIGEEGF